MKNLFLLLSVLLTFAACKNDAAKTTTATTPSVDMTKYPEALQKVFTKHGGLDTWNKMRALSFEIVKEDGNEKTEVDLRDRRERIEAPDFKMGYDGTNFWIEADTSFKRSPVFYKNLMFYFYAMPFVVADDGIVYGKTEPLEFEGKTYPGVRISYNDGVGVSSKDEYFVYYDPATFEMAWLAYTVTYFTNEKSSKLGWIRYNDWKTVNGLVLPNSLTWYKSEEGKPTEVRNTREFAKVTVAEKAFDDVVFAKTEAAEIVKQ